MCPKQSQKWIVVGSMIFLSFICPFVHGNNFPGYAIYHVVASGCSCRGACTPSQDQREEEIQTEEQMAMVEKEMAKVEPEREMGGKTSGVYPALP